MSSLKMSCNEQSASAESCWKSLLSYRYYEPSIGEFTTLDSFAGDATNPLSYNKYLYTNGDPVNGIDPTGQMDVSLGGVLAAIGVTCTISAISLPAIQDAWNHANHIAANGATESLFTAIFKGEATWDDFSRVIEHFEKGYVAGAMNMLDNLTFHQVPVVHQANQGLWEEQGLSESWIGTGSNLLSWAGTGALYTAAAVWTWEAGGGGTMDVAVLRNSISLGGRSNPWFLHFKYGVNGVWEDATLGFSGGFGDMIIGPTTSAASHVLTGVPVLFPESVLAGGTGAVAFSCVTAAIHAVLRGWGVP